MAADTPTPSSVLHERLLARLRLRHLKLIDALAAHSHLRRAADAIHISQPAATQMLQEVEGLLDTPLFERHARGMRITEAGRLLALHARMVIDAMQVASDGLAALAAQETRALRIGAIEAAIASVLQPALNLLHAQHPKLRLFIEEGNIERLTIGLRAGAFDAVLLRQPARVPDAHRFVPLRSDEVVVIAGIGHPAVQRKRLRLRDLADSRWVLPPAHFAVRQVMEAAWAAERIVPRPHAIQVLTPQLVRALLSQPDVVVPVPRTVLDQLDRSAVAELPLRMNAPIAPLGILYRTDNEVGPLQLLVDFLVAQAKKKP